MASRGLQLPQQTQGGGNEEGVRQRVNRCMMKLSDRDTEAMAASELDAIAKGLTADAFPPFLSAIADARPTDKTPLRRHSLRLLSLLSNSHPAAAVAPHLPRMITAALRRLRDPDSSVRAACVDAVRSMAAAHPAALVAVLLRPLADALLHEQDQCAQISSALSLAAAIDAATSSALDPDLSHHLQRLLPRLVKLLRSNAFKAKSALLSLLGSVAGAGGAGTASLLGLLVPCLVEFLASDDWAARKAAAESLSVLAIREKDLLTGFRSSCISSFESRRFDKVKIVRDSMNRMLDVWKDIPEVPEGNINNAQSQPNPSARDEHLNDGRCPASAVSSFTPSAKRISSSRSPPPSASPIPTTRKNVPSIRNKKLSPPSFHKAEQRPSNWRVEISVAGAPGGVVNDEKLQNGREQGAFEGNVRSRLEARRMLFQRSVEDKGSKLAGLKSVSRIVTCQENGNCEPNIGANTKDDDLNSGHKDGDLSLIRMQLVQIENQQSNLLEVLQKFIGNSQNGLHALETRVHGLEMALEEISRNVALSSGRMANHDPAANTCCRVPGTEFLSAKFWRRNEVRNPGRFSISEAPVGSQKWRVGAQSGLVVNPLAEINPHTSGSPEASPNKVLKNFAHDNEIANAHQFKQ